MGGHADKLALFGFVGGHTVDIMVDRGQALWPVMNVEWNYYFCEDLFFLISDQDCRTRMIINKNSLLSISLRSQLIARSADLITSFGLLTN